MTTGRLAAAPSAALRACLADRYHLERERGQGGHLRQQLVNGGGARIAGGSTRAGLKAQHTDTTL
jgi:hypothetical protein